MKLVPAFFVWSKIFHLLRKGGGKQMTKKQQQFYQLVEEGMEPQEACRIVYPSCKTPQSVQKKTEELLKKKRPQVFVIPIGPKETVTICDDICGKREGKAEIYLTDLIAKSFYGVHQAQCRGSYTHYWLKGGRGSAKSSFISLEIILGMMTEEGANAVVLRKVGHNLRASVFEQLLWAVDALGVTELWEARVSPMEMVYRPNGNKIYFRGADNPRKIKSIKFRKGHARFVWYEELDEFYGMEEIRSINQSLMRGGQSVTVFYSYNPPKSRRNWVNTECLLPRPDRLVHHSVYLDVPRQWLGDAFFVEAEYMRDARPEIYRQEYLGEICGTEGEVFKNVQVRSISSEELETFSNPRRGIDWGYAVDPFHYTVNYYDAARRRLFIYGEIRAVGLTNRRAIALVKEENKNGGPIICDSAEPKSIAEFREAGIAVYGAKKGPDSVNYGIKFLQDMEEIVIDPIRCPKTAEEFTSYEYQRDKTGEYLPVFPDKNNHAIDAVRYSLQWDMQRVQVK